MSRSLGRKKIPSEEEKSLVLVLIVLLTFGLIFVNL